MKKSICLMILCLAIGANAATFTVTKTTDTADGVCDADCSLREAITAANALTGADVIVLPAGTYTTTIVTTNENANANGDLDITGSLSIIGGGEAATFVEASASPGTANDRVFHILGVSTNVLMEGLTVRNGRTVSTATAFRGGGIRNEGNLTLRKVTVSGNQTATRGGGITSTNPGTFLSLDRVTVTNNTANSTGFNMFGGGVFTNFSTVRIRKSTFTSNQAITTVGANLIGNGGGFYALDGDVTIKDSTFSNNSIGGTSATLGSDGAGLRFVGLAGPMNVVLDRLTVTNNQVLTGGSAGAGISVGTAAGAVDQLTINISNSTISNNSVTSSVSSPIGAGMFLNGVGLVTATVTNTNIVNNTATSTNPSFPSGGGGIYCNDAALTLLTSNVSGNSAEIGGGIRNDSSPSDVATFTSSVILNGTTVSSNTSTSGGIANIPTVPPVDFPIGGKTNLTLKNSTVSGNFAASDGGGIFQDQPAATTATTVINNSTIVSNRADSDNAGGGNGGGINNLAGTLTIKNTIVANNSVGLPPLAEKTGKSEDAVMVVGVDLAGNIVSADYNLFETTAGAVISGTSGNNITGVDPNLGAFADNGGFGKTYRLNAASAARNAGDPTNCQDNTNTAVTFDQRGLPRAQGGVRCDIGALEEGGIVWDGGGADNNFSTAANWEGDVVPGTLNYIIFSATSGKNITVDGSHEVRGVIYGGGYAGNMTIDGGDLRVRDIFYLYGGNITCINNGFVNMTVGTQFQRYSGYVIGRINHDFSPGTSENFAYPSGTALGYYPVVINYSPALAKLEVLQNLGGFSFSVRANDGTLTGVNASQSINVNWTLDSFGVSPVDITLNYNDENVGAAAIEENFKFVRRAGSSNTGFTPSIADTFDNFFKLNAVSSFSDWTIGSIAPTVASAFIGGRILTPNGGGIKGAVVVLTGGNLPAPVYSQTNNFGYYRFSEVPVGQNYVVTVNAKRYTFADSSRIVNLLDSLADLDFVSNAP
jgi:CSLREA domain-containing protein